MTSYFANSLEIPETGAEWSAEFPALRRPQQRPAQPGKPFISKRQGKPAPLPALLRGTPSSMRKRYKFPLRWPPVPFPIFTAPAVLRLPFDPDGFAGNPPMVPQGDGMPDSQPALAQPPNSGSEYARWVQSTLNQVSGAGLTVDGIMNLQTRHALQAFQSEHGLIADGIVGPETRQALMEARKALSAQHAKNGANPASSPTAQPTPANSTSATSQPSAEFGYISPFGQHEVWNSEVGASNNAAYIRWIQTSLNRILGLRLAVDGISGSQTRNGVRLFQQRQGLSVDGVVGPQTERALIAAGAGQPPTSSGSYVPIPTLPLPATPPSVTGSASSLRQQIVNIARQELQRWGDGARNENEPALRPTLENYWRTGVGYVPTDASWWSAVPWSAAFISYVMRQAGAGSEFKYSASHSTYIVDAKNNRLVNNGKLFKAYRTNEMAPRLGDLVCKNWPGGSVNYDNIQEGMHTHCDIVVDVQPGKLITVGGNVSDSVKSTPVTVDASGFISGSGYFAVIRVG
jgi:peptidoglycan hydrolase-like protein with peptidoglycan-binding domain